MAERRSAQSRAEARKGEPRSGKPDTDKMSPCASPSCAPTLRDFRPSDLERLYEIDQACFPPGISYPKRELQRFIEQERSRTWVAEVARETAGFLILGEEPQRVGHVITLDVTAAHRRTRVGSALMAAAEDWARRRRLRLIYLETAETNRPAQIFYAARGYVKVQEVENYYGPGLTAWVMILWLSAGERRKG
jgi:[ribosomal protein S18]-alanine N-acetyltransferase